MHAGETDYDYITWGTWPDGEAMYKEWGSFANSYDGAADEVTGGAAGTCRNSVATFFNLVARIPMEIKDRDAKVCAVLTVHAQRRRYAQPGCRARS